MKPLQQHSHKPIFQVPFSLKHADLGCWETSCNMMHCGPIFFLLDMKLGRERWKVLCGLQQVEQVLSGPFCTKFPSLSSFS